MRNKWLQWAQLGRSWETVQVNRTPTLSTPMLTHTCVTLTLGRIREQEFSLGWEGRSTLSPVVFWERLILSYLSEKNWWDVLSEGIRLMSHPSSLLGNSIGIPNTSSLTAFLALRRVLAPIIVREIWKETSPIIIPSAAVGVKLHLEGHGIAKKLVDITGEISGHTVVIHLKRTQKLTKSNLIGYYY